MASQLRLKKAMLIIGALVLLGVILVVLVVPRVTGLRTLSREMTARQEALLSGIDHSRLLGSCRVLMKTRRDIPTNRPDLSEAEETYIEFPYSQTNRLPPAIVELDPARVIIRDDNVLIVIYGGHARLGIRAFAEGVEGYGTRKLTEGLWIVSQ